MNQLIKKLEELKIGSTTFNYGVQKAIEIVKAHSEWRPASELPHEIKEGYSEDVLLKLKSDGIHYRVAYYDHRVGKWNIYENSGLIDGEEAISYMEIPS